MDVPETRYVKNGDTYIAYAVLGEGPIDLVLVLGFATHLELMWEHPPLARMLRRLASFSRLILFDKRGVGLSDRAQVVATLEERMDDVRAVMDAVGSERAAILGVSEGAPMSLLFAATYPERVQALIIFGGYTTVTPREDHPAGFERAFLDAFNGRMVERWGTPWSVKFWAPSMRQDPAFRAWWPRYLKMAASPGAATSLMSLYPEIDVRHALKTISAPTLVLHPEQDLISPLGAGQYIAEHVKGARLVVLPGADHLPWVGANADRLSDETQEFLTGARAAPEPDRVLATVLYTDIVNSTAHAATMGDARWRGMLDEHASLARREIDRARGRLVKTTGDGVLATFDGPARAVRCASALRAGVARLGLSMRAGLHAGEIELMGDEVSGIAVHIGARIAAMAGEGEILTSSTVKDLVTGSGIGFAERGAHALKGVPGEWRVFAVERA
ncbi:MAG: alpha/beta fold hydrolase [Hyphomonadaceae bacterium]